MNTPAPGKEPTSAPISGGTPSDSTIPTRQEKAPIRWAPRIQRWIANAGYDTDKKRRRKKFLTKEDAERWRTQQLAAADALSDAAVNLPRSVLLDVAAALKNLGDAHREVPPGYFSTLAAEDLRRAPDARTTTFETVVDFWLETKTTRKLKPRSIADCRECISPFVTAVGAKPIGQILREDIEAVLNAYGDVRKRNLWSKAHGALDEAKRRRLVLDNAAEGIILPVLPEREPTPLASDKARRFLQLAAATEETCHATAWIIARLLLGLRDAESKRLRWAESPESPDGLNVDRGFCAVDGKRRPRTLWLAAEHCTDPEVAAVIPTYALSMLRDLRLRYPQHCSPGAPVYPGRWHADELKRVAREAGIVLEQNCLRASFVSHHVARFKQPKLTAHWIGHRGDIRVMERHYLKYATYPDGLALFDGVTHLVYQ